jgi:hypothetical protein
LFDRGGVRQLDSSRQHPHAAETGAAVEWTSDVENQTQTRVEQLGGEVGAEGGGRGTWQAGDVSTTTVRQLQRQSTVDDSQVRTAAAGQRLQHFRTRTHTTPWSAVAVVWRRPSKRYCSMQQQQRHCQAPLFAVQMPDGRRWVLRWNCSIWKPVIIIKYKATCTDARLLRVDSPWRRAASCSLPGAAYYVLLLQGALVSYGVPSPESRTRIARGAPSVHKRAALLTLHARLHGPAAALAVSC